MFSPSTIHAADLGNTCHQSDFRLPAAGLLGDDLERAVRRVVRRAVRRGQADTLIGGRVQAAADSLVRQSSLLRIDQQRLITRVARRLCELLRIQARCAPRSEREQ
jgi:hypothetical protein